MVSGLSLKTYKDVPYLEIKAELFKPLWHLALGYVPGALSSGANLSLAVYDLIPSDLDMVDSLTSYVLRFCCSLCLHSPSLRSLQS